MSRTAEAVAVAQAPAVESSLRWSDWLALTRPRIGGFVWFAGFCGALLAPGMRAHPARAAEAGLWIALTAAGASVYNQILEKHSDGLMRRTADRPLASGRMRPRTALVFGASLLGLGVAMLSLRFDVLAALLAMATFTTYVLVYTPLKRLSAFNTVLGAFPGAMPPLLGYAAACGRVDGWAWALSALLFAWQFPHFIAIGWLYRDDYRRAGIRLLPGIESDGQAGAQALAYSAASLIVSLVPWLQGRASPVYGLGALVLGLGYLGFAALFTRSVDERRARWLLRWSLLHLPVLYALVLVDPLVRASAAVLLTNP